ncbi:FtsK/SpoIIIE domain-containing protein [Nesterenkonia ebinurensis]|uniref:FtsK/SpoIIIE domain-containing protein n=1 Tax=Nesterenkonia ebinurensis TaxID=2608252 RepID=UPI00123E108E|nr:FtsK/SpoIIIE domain-containing protein [Nesterenkonia ebinurensis]
MFAVTVVHAPGALPAGRWERLRGLAPGAHDHELRLHLDQAADSVTGAALADALHRFLDTESAQLSTAGHPLHTLEASDPMLHPGMVVLAAPAEHRLTAVRPAQLSLCVDTGPDAGRLIPLRRGQYSIGRGRADVQLADPTVSRQAAVLEIGTREIRLHQDRGTEPRLITVDSEIHLGSSRLALSLGPPQRNSAPHWPPAPEPVGAKAAEGKHKMMLAFALVPLIAGIVLVILTGMWLFLMFSGASALIAATVFWDGQRRRRKYRQAVRRAAAAWAERAAEALCSPGELIRQLRSTSPHPVHAGAAAESGPALRIGTGNLTAQLDYGSSEPENHNDDAAALTAVGMSLEPGEVTSISAPPRETQRLLRWVLVQLVLNPARPQVVVLGGPEIPELEDLPQLCQSSESELADLLRAQAEPRVTRVLLCAQPADNTLIKQALSARWHVLTPASAAGQLPGWSIDLPAGTVEQHSGTGRTEATAEQLCFEGLSAATLAEHLRLSLRHACAAGGPGQVPARCSHPLPDQLFTEAADQSLLATLGRSSDGEQTLDLVGDGPHVLLAGTTGSGKSELLKTLLVSLCARYGPDELGMVLIDFKGGAAFHQLGALEHTLGVVTDLSQAAAERTLEGIRSELIRRERLFLASGAGDYTEYRSMVPQQPLARILVVIDEFRIFSHELPDQLDELMRLATLGRSLGLHLVLSTQRPQGVVTADIRANIGASICLRVRSEDESRDVIAGPEAAHLPRDLPGRALLRRPGEQPVLFQTAQLSGSRQLQLCPESQPVPPAATGDFRAAVQSLQQASSAAGHRRSHTPLLPALPETLRWDDRLDAAPTSSILLGRLDDPAGQRQEDLVLDMQHPYSLAMLGESGSGAAQAVAAAAGQALSTIPSAEVHLLDGDRSLTGLAEHPRTGSWLTDEHMPEVEHLLQALHEQMLARRMGHRMGPGADRPILLAVTGYFQWHAVGQIGSQLLDHLLGTLAAEGSQAGISVLIAGGRELAVGKLAARVPRRVYLPLGTSDEVRYLWPSLRSTDPLPGRGVLTTAETPAPGLTVQLVTEFSAPVPSSESADPPLVRVRPLPDRISSTDLPQGAPAAPVVGVQQFSWSPAHLELGPVNLILGTRGTGKSSCLQLLAQQIPGAFLLSPGSPAPQIKPAVLLVDDAASCSTEQHDLIQQAVTAEVPVVATGAASSSVFSQLSWAHRARAEGANVILSPTSRSQADAFATIIPVLPHPVPGRAVHLRPEGPALVQWALPETSAPKPQIRNVP